MDVQDHKATVSFIFGPFLVSFSLVGEPDTIRDSELHDRPNVSFVKDLARFLAATTDFPLQQADH